MPASVVLGPDARPVRLGEAARDRQPEAGSLGVAVAAVERLEDELSVIRRDARPPS